MILASIQNELREVAEAIAETERAIAEFPEASELPLAASSLAKRQRKLEAEFLAEAEAMGVDVCSYRLFTDEGRIPAHALGTALVDFQNLFTRVYDALKTGQAKARGHASSATAREAEFEFAYAFAGSVGVVLSIPNQRLLFGEAQLDEAFKVLLELVKPQDAAGIQGFARRLGRASIRALYTWAKDHATAGLGADIQWRRGAEMRSSVFIQPQELRDLYLAIDEITDHTTDELKFRGELFAVDLKARTFGARDAQGHEIHGKFAPTIGRPPTVELPSFYTVSIQRTVVVKYSTDEEVVSYQLLRLDPLF